MQQRAIESALILYRPDVRPLFEGRPALELVDRLLPEPARRRRGAGAVSRTWS